MYCGNCGSKRFEDNAFCENCGQKISENTEEQEKAQPIALPIEAERDKPKAKKVIIVALAALLLVALIVGAVIMLIGSDSVGTEVESGDTEGEMVLATHTITVRLNFPGAEDAPPLIIAEGTTIADIPTPERPRYIFVHWTSDRAGQNILSPETSITANSTLYAQWELSAISVDVFIEPTWEFDQVFDFSEGMAAVEIFAEGDWEWEPDHILGYMNSQGEIVIPIEYRHVPEMYAYLGAPPFSDGLVIVHSLDHDGVGIFDLDGRLVVPFQHDWGWTFSEGRAIISNWELGTSVIDSTGEIVVPFGRYSVISDFSEGLAAVNAGDWNVGRWGFIDRAGDELIPAEFQEAGNFSEGLAPVMRNNQWGFIDANGEVIIPFQFDSYIVMGMWEDEAVPPGFFEGRAAIWQVELVPNHFGGGYFPSRRWGFIDRENNAVSPFAFDWVTNFSEGRAVVHDQQGMGVIDLGGALVVPFGRYGHINSFSESRAAVMTGSWDNPRWGFIDRLGEEIILPQYTEVHDFSEGLAAVNIGTWDNPRWGFIDTDGNVVVPFEYDEVRSFSEGLAWVRSGNLWGLLQIT